jgi:hypothetical protein
LFAQRYDILAYYLLPIEIYCYDFEKLFEILKKKFPASILEKKSRYKLFSKSVRDQIS